MNCKDEQTEEDKVDIIKTYIKQFFYCLDFLFLQSLLDRGTILWWLIYIYIIYINIVFFFVFFLTAFYEKHLRLYTL